MAALSQKCPDQLIDQAMPLSGIRRWREGARADVFD